jgi:hypothetical protein
MSQNINYLVKIYLKASTNKNDSKHQLVKIS